MFESLKLIKPFWYFHLQSGDRSFWPDPTAVNPPIEIDTQYDSHKSAIQETSFLLLMEGWLPGGNKTSQLSLPDLSYKPSIKDEFRFLRKHFNPGWSMIYFLYCIFTLKNPIRVLHGFCKTMWIKKQLLFSEPVGVTRIPEDDGLQLILKKEPVRIIIPTYNRYNVLHDVLRDLEQMDYGCFSVTVVDQSDPINGSFYNKYKIDINLVRQESPGLWRARNRAIQDSREGVIVLLDDDSRLAPNWLRKHLQCLGYFKAEISAGVSISTHGAKVPENYSFYRISDQLDTGNVVLRRSVFETCGLFDEQFEGMRMGDGEFGLRAYKAGFLSISNPEAKRSHLKQATGGLREMGSWDALRPTNIFKPRPIPSVLYLAYLHFEKSIILFYLLTSVPFSLSPYPWKSSLKGVIVSLLLFFLLFPVVLFQVFRSWLIARSLNKEGPKVSTLIPLESK